MLIFDESIGEMRPVCVKDIAKALGLSLSTVYQCLSEHPEKCTIKKQTVEHVRQFASAVGYSSKDVRRYSIFRTRQYLTSESAIKRARSHMISGTMFSSYDDMVSYMLKLRNKGFTNAEIAQKSGCSVRKVIGIIGVQPKHYTQTSMKLAGKKRRDARIARAERSGANDCVRKENVRPAQDFEKDSHSEFGAA